MYQNLLGINTTDARELAGISKGFVKTIVNSNTGSRSEIEPLVSGYSQHRKSLKKKHIIDTSENGYVRINLPRFREYIDAEW